VCSSDLTFYTFVLLLLTQSHHAEYLPSVALCVLILPSLLSFLVYNQYPARIFMGDSGSMALGGLIAGIGLMTHQDAWLLLTAGIYAFEALSVLLQIMSFKLLKRRIFKMAPVHHHFELCGYHETVVVHGFVLTQGILCLLAFYLQRL
jgi:phospho-N-acetylmuramoyl-pentapeptide-transferase